MNEAEEILAGKIGVQRVLPLQQLTAGTWHGTDEVVASVVQESLHKHGWRPTRAAALLAGAEINERGRVWMTAAEFAMWIKIASAIAKVRGEPRQVALFELGMTKGRIYDLAREERIKLRALRIHKVEALACAHYAMGLERPLEIGNAEALSEWFTPRFGNITNVAAFLDVSDAWLANRLRGWSLVKGERKETPPEGFLIRSLDWLYRVGPICPYGDRPAVDLWPGQGAPAR